MKFLEGVGGGGEGVFPEEGGVPNKKPLIEGGSMDIFWNCTSIFAPLLYKINSKWNVSMNGCGA